METEWKVKTKQQFKNDALNNWNTPSKTGYLNLKKKDPLQNATDVGSKYK